MTPRSCCFYDTRFSNGGWTAVDAGGPRGCLGDPQSVLRASAARRGDLLSCREEMRSVYVRRIAMNRRARVAARSPVRAMPISAARVRRLCKCITELYQALFSLSLFFSLDIYIYALISENVAIVNTLSVRAQTAFFARMAPCESVGSHHRLWWFFWTRVSALSLPSSSSYCSWKECRLIPR